MIILKFQFLWKDVVPMGGDGWTYDPFLGEVVSEDNMDYIFGRGTIDDKQVFWKYHIQTLWIG